MQDTNHKQTIQGEGPAELAGNAVRLGSEIAEEIVEMPPVKEVRKFWHKLGPGLITGAADDDASGVVIYSQTGAVHGPKLLWLAPLTFPIMAIVQEMCARIGLVTGRGLAANIKKYFPKPILYIAAFLLFAANAFNIGADLGAMAEVTKLLIPAGPFWIFVLIFAVIILLMQIFISYERYAKFLKYLTLILLVYVVAAFVIKDFDWANVLKHVFIPSFSFNKEDIILLTGILGTTISPYLFFWETSQEVEEKIANGQGSIVERQQSVDRRAIRKMRTDVWTGMFFSNLVMFFIIAVSAETLFKNGITNINTAADAARALQPLAGQYAYLLFSLGIIGTGLLGIPVLAGSASYAVSESFGWREGLNRKFRQAGLFYGVIILAVLVGLGLNFIGLDPIKALIYAAVLNGIIAPIILIFIMILAGRRKIMGEWANRPHTNILGWIITILMLMMSVATLYFIFYG